jgi:hypothetical protein
MPRLVEIRSNQRGSGASARPRLNTWVVVFLICISLIAVFAMELHLRKVEHRSLSLLRDDCFATAGVVARQRPASVPDLLILDSSVCRGILSCCTRGAANAPMRFR